MYSKNSATISSAVLKMPIIKAKQLNLILGFQNCWMWIIGNSLIIRFKNCPLTSMEQ
jgi:hypothetical protein